MWEPRGLPLGEIGATLSATVQGVHFLKEAVVVKGSLILVIHVSGLHIDLNQLKIEATP